MSVIDTEWVPRREWYVRRRKYEGAVWLVARNRFFRVDDTTDTVWLATDGVRPIAEIARDVAAKLQWPLDEAFAAVLLALHCLKCEGLVDYGAEAPP
jgi:hypothetical protein